MAYEPHPDAYDGSLHRSFREPLLERVLPGEEFRPLRFLYLGQWYRDSLCSISAADPKRWSGMLCFVLQTVRGLSGRRFITTKAHFR